MRKYDTIGRKIFWIFFSFFSTTMEKEVLPSEPVHNSFVCFYSGIIDALSFHNCILFLFTSKSIRIRALQCFLLNGVIFLGSLFLAEYVLIPMIHYSVSVIFSESFSGSMLPMIESVFRMLHHFFWIYPIYCISFILNSIWYQDIANYAFIIHGNKPSREGFTMSRFMASIAQEIYRLLLLALLYVQILIFSQIPIFGNFIFGFYFCFLYAFYSFEYKWNLENKPLESRITYFETRWIYFCGFGFPSVVLTYVFPGFVSVGLFALAFPLFILLAIVADPLIHSDLSGVNSTTKLSNWQRFPIFSIAKRINVALLRICNCFRGKRSTR